MHSLYALFVGILVGAFFTFFKVPIPAPPSLAGIMTIVGVYLGYVIVNHFRGL